MRCISNAVAGLGGFADSMACQEYNDADFARALSRFQVVRSKDFCDLKKAAPSATRTDVGPKSVKTSSAPVAPVCHNGAPEPFLPSVISGGEDFWRDLEGWLCGTARLPNQTVTAMVSDIRRRHSQQVDSLSLDAIERLAKAILEADQLPEE